MRASLAGDAPGTYQGTGDFLDQRDRPIPPKKEFSVISASTGRQQSFRFYRQNGNRPRPGRYPLELFDPRDLGEDRFYGFYERVNGDWYEEFAAVSGYVEITASSPDRVEGTLTVTARRYCAGPLRGLEQIGPCDLMSGVPDDAPTIQVSGSFSAIPLDPEADLVQ